MIRTGLSVAEPLEWRDSAQSFVTGLTALEWSGKMKALAELVPVSAKQYGVYAEAARSRGDTAQAIVCNFMVEHELAQEEFARMELAGVEPATSLEPLMRQSRYPLPLDE
jgi:hypothetical protein